MKKLLTLALALSAFAVNAQTRTRTTTPARTNYSFASTTEHEFVISPSTVTVESYKQGKSYTTIDIYGVYNYHLKENIQVGGEAGIISLPDGGDMKTFVALMGVFTYNFDSNLRESFFVQGGLGLYPSWDKDDSEYDSKISFFGGVGKRFEMWGKVNYMPQVRLWKRGDENVRFQLQALNFSIFF